MIENISISSVVPKLNYTIRSSMKKYLGKEPIFLVPPVKTGISIKYKFPNEIGSDRIANCIGAIKLYGLNNFIIIDIGTATTFDILTDKKDYLGGIIYPGPGLQMESLFHNTAKLPSIEIIPMKDLQISSTNEAIQSGIYFINYYGFKGVIDFIKTKFFKNKDVLVIGTGGFSKLYENEKIFDYIEQNLILYGLNELININKKEER